jgi:hypothetical protein
MMKIRSVMDSFNKASKGLAPESVKVLILFDDESTAQLIEGVDEAERVIKTNFAKSVVGTKAHILKFEVIKTFQLKMEEEKVS